MENTHSGELLSNIMKAAGLDDESEADVDLFVAEAAKTDLSVPELTKAARAVVLAKRATRKAGATSGVEDFNDFWEAFQANENARHPSPETREKTQAEMTGRETLDAGWAQAQLNERIQRQKGK